MIPLLPAPPPPPSLHRVQYRAVLQAQRQDERRDEEEREEEERRKREWRLELLRQQVQGESVARP